MAMDCFTIRNVVTLFIRTYPQILIVKFKILKGKNSLGIYYL